MTGPRILLVEDEASIAEPFARLLTREGFEPTIAPTAARAVALYEQEAPDLVLLDLNLPDGDGRDIARELRSRSDVPIIMLTARGTETDRVVGLEIGADDYVVKPFSTAEVVARIRAVLRRAAARDEVVDDDAPGEPIEIDELRIDPAARRVFLGDEELELSRKEFELLVELARNAGTGRHARGPDGARLGRELVRLDEDARRPHRLAAAQARRRRLRAALDRHRPRRRLPLRRAGRGRRAVSLRRGLLLALAYVLVLAIVALLVPLGLSLRDRVDAEVRLQARSEAEVVAARATSLIAPPRVAQLDALARARRARRCAGAC